MKTAYGLALPLYGLAAVVWALALVLTVVATTGAGRACGLAFAIGTPGLFFLSIAPLRRRALGGGLLALALPAGLGFAAWQAPSGASGDRFQSHWTGEVPYPAFALSNLVPEVDQFTLGSYLAPVDPYLSGAKAARLRGLFQDIYGQGRQDPEFVQMGSSMSFAYRPLFGRSGRSDHVYVVKPPGQGPFPTAMFLHGSLGNFKGYQWVLMDLALRCEMAIVSPDFGAGFWSDPEGLLVIDRALAWVVGNPQLQGGPMPLMGLSNGGLGVTRAALDRPQDWTQLVYITGVLERSRAAEVHATGLPVTVLDAEDDLRIPKRVIDQAMDDLPDAHRRSWPDEDHFLFFSRPDEVVDELAARLCPP